MTKKGPNHVSNVGRNTTHYYPAATEKKRVKSGYFKGRGVECIRVHFLVTLPTFLLTDDKLKRKLSDKRKPLREITFFAGNLEGSRGLSDGFRVRDKIFNKTYLLLKIWGLDQSHEKTGGKIMKLNDPFETLFDSDKSECLNAILRANSSQSERVSPRGIGKSKGVKNKGNYRAKSRKPNCRLYFRS